MKKLGITSVLFALLFSVLALSNHVPAFADGIDNNSGQAIAGGPAAPMDASGFYNLNSANLSVFRRAVARVRSATARGKIVIISDSSGMGAGAGTSGTSNLNGAAQKAWPQLLHQFNAASPVSLSSNSWWGTQGYDGAAGITISGYDTRLTLGANWSPNLSTLGGKVIRYATGAVNNLSFAPTYAFDTIVVYFLKNSGNGSATINVDGGASLGTITTSNASLIWATQTFTVSKGTHTINIIPNNDGQMFFGGILAYDSTVPAVDVIQTSVYGALASTFTPNVNVYDAIPTLKFIAPDLTIICLTINPSNNGTPLATYSADMQTIATAAKVSGDVIFLIGAPSNTTQATDGTLDLFVNANQQLAITNSSPLLSLKRRWVSYAYTNTTLPYFDTLHPGVLGYQDIALFVYEAISDP